MRSISGQAVHEQSFLLCFNFTIVCIISLQPPDGVPLYKQLLESGMAKVFVDGTTVEESSLNIKDCYLYWLAAFPVFNLSYPVTISRSSLY